MALTDTAIRLAKSGDTVRAREVTLVAAVGGQLKGRPLTRRGARAGMRVCLGGNVGDASAGELMDAAAFAFSKWEDRPAQRPAGAVAAPGVTRHSLGVGG